MDAVPAHAEVGGDGLVAAPLVRPLDERRRAGIARRDGPQQFVDVRDAGVVATLGERGDAGAVDVLRSHARHLEQRHPCAGAGQRLDARLQLRADMAVPFRGAEGEQLTVARLEVEDVPRPEHDEGDVGAAVADGARPRVLPPGTHRERVGESGPRAAHVPRVVHAAAVE